MPYSTVRCGDSSGVGDPDNPNLPKSDVQGLRKTASDEFAEDFVGREEAAFRNMDP